MPGTVQIRVAGSEDYDLRFYSISSRGSQAAGRYLTPTFPGKNARGLLTLPPGNEMTGIAQFRLRPGVEYLYGRVAPNFGEPGGGIEIHVANLSDLIPVR